MSISVLQVRNLTTQFEIGHKIYTLVDQLNFDLIAGKTLALVGESGCGKSLTALSLMRMLPTPPAIASQGEILYKNQNLLNLSEKEMSKIRGAEIAMIFQDPMSSLNPVYTVGEQLMEVAEQHLNLNREEAFTRAEQALISVGITQATQRLFAYPHQLSGGIKQRVMIAMALICEPDILIADEPTTALDVTIQAQVLQLFKELQIKKNLAILLITHDMGVVSEMADEVMVMYATQAVEKAYSQNLLNDPAHPYTMGLFQSLPALHNEKKRLKPIRGQVPSFRAMPAGCHFHPRCPFAMKKCSAGEVQNFILGAESPHLAKCWLYDGSEESTKNLLNLKNEKK